MNLQELIEKVKRESGLTDPEHIAMLARLTVRSAELVAAQAIGENVDDEIAIVKATALNLTEHAKSVLSANVLSFINTIAVSIFQKLLA